MVAIEEIYDLIDRAHTRTQHGGRDILKYACRNFGGIPQEAYQMYLNLCEQCELKKVKVKKGIVVKPILSSEMNRDLNFNIPAEIAQEVVETTFGSSPEQELYDFGALLDRIQHERSEAERNLKRQAERMLSASNKRLQPVSPGSSVRIPVPNVDRAKVDHRNVIGVVMEAEDGFYRLGTKQGMLPQLFTRNQF
uniref:Uncharacterized protein n=1 Tax=Acrobeloides nanus TaxID=290746 RepID=A0A914D043_9BILA